MNADHDKNEDGRAPAPHEHAAAARRASTAGQRAGFAIITVSDTRTEATDASGKLARELIGAAGHAVASAEIVKDEKHLIEDAVLRALANPSVHIVFLTGGTGVSPRDTTPEAIGDLLEKSLPGFGELFRSLSLAEIGTATILSRAMAGTARGKVIFCVPGSRAAVRLAVEKIIIPESAHLLNELSKGESRRKSG